MNGWQRSAGWVLAWAVAAGCGAAWLAHGRLQSLREVFDTDARIAHRLLSQRMVQHDAILGTAKAARADRKSTRLNSSHLVISYAVFCLKKKKQFEPYSVDNSTSPQT